MAVYTQVHSADLEAALDAFGLGKLHSFRGIAEGVENSNYLVETDQARYILTLYEKRVDKGDLPFFLGLMEHLARNGVNCPLPQRDASGEALFGIAGRPAAFISYLDGIAIEEPDAEKCAQLGAALAQLHAAQTGFEITRPNALSLAGWQDLAKQTAKRADEVELGLADLIETEVEALSKGWADVDDLPQGVIHADLFPDNVFFLEGQLSGFIDFYFACNDALAYDIAICVNAWCFDCESQFLPKHAAAMVSEYHGKRPLNQKERDLLPLMCRGAALRFLLTRLYDWLNPAPGAIVRPKDPLDYARRLTFFQTWAGT